MSNCHKHYHSPILPQPITILILPLENGPLDRAHEHMHQIARQGHHTHRIHGSHVGDQGEVAIGEIWEL